MENFHTLVMRILATPPMANFAGVVHGGELLKILDQVAYACAARFCGHYAVTLSVDQVLFRQPIKVGSLMNFIASVNFTGKTSMEIGIKVVAEDVQKRFSVHTNTCLITMVAKDSDGKPCPIPQLEPQTDEEKRRFEEGRIRREQRLAKKQ
ncbi:acyl-CoA thioesterase [Helicobacter monodelphidis]|uniref:acyl-CoA thioesterase n=1 Tax=Helicobacter sp. 15-1451 TaxID=2004995 RepID=UPI000DCC4397|nr:acyl-CoA thioesterase [Helicobacter sp. 15-1451]RAX56970.1 acyl-CoA thioesterase [Helicobacter sp. 15-1451]